MFDYRTWILLGLLMIAVGQSRGAASLAAIGAHGAEGTGSQISNEILSTLKALRAHIKGKAVLSDSEIADYKSLLDSKEEIFGEHPSAPLISAAFALLADYESILGPIFLNPQTRGGFKRKDMGSDIHTTVFLLMQAIVDELYTSETLARHDDLLNGFRFKSADYFPGAAEPPTDPEKIHTVKISASCPKTFGHRVMNDSAPARKPTGTYLAPGTIATITVPKSIVGKGYGIRVGANSWDMSKKPRVKRLDRSTIVYPIDHAETKVASPLGGGIYVEVPDLADAGILEVQIKNALRSPYFSAKPFHNTTLSDWQKIERKHAAPWADFQSEKVLIQVPSSWIYNFDDPATMLNDWDRATDAVSDLMGFPRIRGKEVLYLQPDVVIKSGAYSPGYPQVNATYDPNKDYGGNRNHYFLTGPQHSPAWELHEMGHGQLFQKFKGETEAAVNLPYVAAMQRKFGMSLDEAFYRSRRYDNSFMTLANTAITWMASENFKLERPMVAEEMRYQLKGHAKYVEIAHLFGWEVLDKYWYSINQDFEAGIKIKGSRNSGDTNSLILRMSKAAGADLTPLIHFWGSHPGDVVAMKASIEAAKLPASAKIYDLLVQYQASIPANNLAFRKFARKWWEKQPTSEGYKTEKYHAVLWDAWDDTYAKDIRSKLQNIIDLYFPQGRP
jgi:Peptidase M60, enhancin and enhancin-like/N-terminal domain of M60-like peptidases